MTSPLNANAVPFLPVGYEEVYHAEDGSFDMSQEDLDELEAIDAWVRMQAAEENQMELYVAGLLEDDDEDEL